jgi:hypothetical protein
MVIMSVGEAGWDRDSCSTVRRVGMRAHRRAGNPSWHFHCVRLESAATRRRKAQRARAVCGYLRDRLSCYRLPAPHDHRPPRPRDRRMRDQTRATVISASATTPAGPTRPARQATTSASSKHSATPSPSPGSLTTNSAVAGLGLAAAHRLRSFSGRARLPAGVGHFRHGPGGPSEADGSIDLGGIADDPTGGSGWTSSNFSRSTSPTVTSGTKISRAS